MRDARELLDASLHALAIEGHTSAPAGKGCDRCELMAEIEDFLGTNVYRNDDGYTRIESIESVKEKTK